MAVITGPIRTPHPVEACYGSHLHCFYHEEDEAPEGFRICGECYHVFVTPGDLLAAHNAILQEMGAAQPETDVLRVFCCPYCIHDW